jgi:hypothetical protein
MPIQRPWRTNAGVERNAGPQICIAKPLILLAVPTEEDKRRFTKGLRRQTANRAPFEAKEFSEALAREHANILLVAKELERQDKQSLSDYSVICKIGRAFACCVEIESTNIETQYCASAAKLCLYANA